MSKTAISPRDAIIIDVHSFLNIPIITRNVSEGILALDNIPRFQSSKVILTNLLSKLDELIHKHDVNMIILEQNKLFTDTIDRYPDPSVLHNVQLEFKIQTLIEYLYGDTIDYLLALPEQMWRSKILNKYTKYSIDMYKSHILHQNIDHEMLDIIESNNYYRALCLSECITYDTLMQKTYQIN